MAKFVLRSIWISRKYSHAIVQSVQNAEVCLRSWVRNNLSSFQEKETSRIISLIKKIIHHYFCTNCGVSSFAKGVKEDGSVGYAVNVRCLDDVDLGSLKVVEFDGKSM